MGTFTIRRASMDFSRACFLSSPWWRRNTSISWWPTVNTGFREVMGSWKIMDTRLPRILRKSFMGMSSRLWPSRVMEPETLALGWVSRMMDRAVMLLPQPDSPTMPRVSPL